MAQKSEDLDIEIFQPEQKVKLEVLHNYEAKHIQTLLTASKLYSVKVEILSKKVFLEGRLSDLVKAQRIILADKNNTDDAQGVQDSIDTEDAISTIQGHNADDSKVWNSQNQHPKVPPIGSQPSDQSQDASFTGSALCAKCKLELTEVEDACARSPAPKLLPVSKTENEICAICCDDITNRKVLPCNHAFCRECIDRWLKVKSTCPTCSRVHGVIKGTQPNGKMKDKLVDKSLPGFPLVTKTIQITYTFPNGTQGKDHPNPGSPYRGITRDAFLPDTREGREVLGLLRRAWEARLIFTIGRSVTTGREGCITWNDIHHKTNIKGGPEKFGYPDPTYLQRVKSELAAKGIK